MTPPVRTSVFTVIVIEGQQCDLVSDLLWSAGVQGIEERRLSNGRIGLRSTFGVEAEETQSLLQHLLRDPMVASPCRDVEWTIDTFDPRVIDRWREFAEIVEITPELVVVPAWLPTPDFPCGVHVLTIDPGGTFGMGDHPTTRGALQLVSGHVRPGDVVLDVGCGSGILGITAISLGASRAQGIDINPASVAVSIDNAQRNGCGEQWSVSLAPIDAIDETFDVVIANILPEVLIELAPSILDHVRSSGVVILSGILDRHVERICRAFAPLNPTASISIGGWTSLALRS